jgi:hypothetical protein
VKVDEALMMPSGLPDMKKIKPIVGGHVGYYGVGNLIGKAFSVGKTYK